MTIARTDEVQSVPPNPCRALPQTHPDLLATVATIFGLRPGHPEQCRVLEIGCGDGSNLIPMAETLAGARFVGIDPSQRRIEAGTATVKALGLSNIDLRHQDPAQFAAEEGPFDYIIVHGVYSRLSGESQQKLLDLCARHLAPQGVAYISYNTYPGWLGLGMLRDMMHHDARSVTSDAERINRARALLDFLAQAAPTDRLVPGGPLGGALTAPWAALLKGLAQSIKSLGESELLDQYLCELNDPLYFHEFMRRAAEHGLQYLGDAQLETMSPAAFGSVIEAALRKVASDHLEAEQLLDLLRNRATRQTLLVRADSGGPHPVNPESVTGLYAGSAIEPTPDQSGEFTFRHPKGPQFSTTDPFVRATLRALGDAWPGRLSFADLVNDTWQQLGLGPSLQSAGGLRGGVESKLAALLLQGFFTGMIDLSVRPADWATELPDRPAVRPLARLQAETTDTVTTLRHQDLKLNRMARQLLQLLDGTRDPPKILADLEQSIRASAKAIGGKATLGKEDRARLARGLDHDLKRFVAEGLIVK